MTLRITQGYILMKMLYKLPIGMSISTHDLWRRTNFKKKEVGNKLTWLRNRGLVKSDMIRGNKNGAPYKKALNYLTNDGRKYIKRKIERERLEKLYPPVEEENVI
jgi:transcription initiation factor IIE alpha subunit